MPITLTKYILVILHSSPFYLENPSRVLAVKEIASSRSIILFRSPIQYHRFLFNNSIPRPCSISDGPVQSLRSVFCEDSPSFLLNSSPSRSLYQPLTPSQYVSRWRPMRDRCFNIGSALIYSSCRSAFSLKVAMLSWSLMWGEPLSSSGFALEPLFAGVCGRFWSSLLPLIKAVLSLIGNWSSLFNSHRSDIMAAGKRSPWQSGHQRRINTHQRIFSCDAGNFTLFSRGLMVLMRLFE